MKETQGPRRRRRGHQADQENVWRWTLEQAFRVAWNVVIAGGGFAGSTCARSWSACCRSSRRGWCWSTTSTSSSTRRSCPRPRPGLLEPRHVVTPLREILKRTYLRLGAVTAHDPAARTVELPDARRRVRGAALRPAGALGRLGLPHRSRCRASTSTRSASRASPTRSGSATTSSRRLEVANATEDPARREQLLTYVFVGGGYAGLEALAELQDFAADAMDRYPRARLHGMRWILVEATDRVLPEIDPSLADYAAPAAPRARDRDPAGDDARGGRGRQRHALDRRDGADPDRRLDRRGAAASEPPEPLGAARRARPGQGRRPPAGRGPGGRLGDRRLRRRPRPRRRAGAADRPARDPPGPSGGRATSPAPSAASRRDATATRAAPPSSTSAATRRSGMIGRRTLLRLPRLVDGADLPPEPDPRRSSASCAR